MGVRNWVMVASAWAMTAAPALAAGPELAGGPAPEAGQVRQDFHPSQGHERSPRSVEAQQYEGRPLSRPAYVAPDEPGYAPVQSYGFRGYDQAVYAAGPGPDAGFRGYDQAVYAAEGQGRYMDRTGDRSAVRDRAQEDDRDVPPPEPGYAPPPHPPTRKGAAECPPERAGERVIRCEYRPHWQEVTVSGDFTGGVGVVPIGAYAHAGGR